MFHHLVSRPIEIGRRLKPAHKLSRINLSMNWRKVGLECDHQYLALSSLRFGQVGGVTTNAAKAIAREKATDFFCKLDFRVWVSELEVSAEVSHEDCGCGDEFSAAFHSK